MREFTREELQNIRDRAEDSAQVFPSIYWKRAYENLADSANNLDAIMARTEISSSLKKNEK
jgi:hypothetical protein